jgi:ribosomal protein L17
MRHLKAHRKLGRTTEHRISLLRNLATSLINAEKEHIVTTVPKAKELRPFVEKAITLARKAQGLEGADGSKERRALKLFKGFLTSLVRVTRIATVVIPE